MRIGLSAVILVSLVGAASAEGQRATVERVRPPGPIPAAGAHYLYLNRCTGGCTVIGGADDARSLTSSIAAPGSNHMTEFANDTGGTGTAADAAWNAILTCVQEVYSPFGITVSDQLPTNGVSFTEGIVAGNPTEIGLPDGYLGVGVVYPDCSPSDNIISFSFANHENGTGLSRTYDTCWTVAQETAHSFGLDHEYQFTDGQSACSDPMTYRTDCGGQKFFRNKPAACGENVARTCKCGGVQNSVVKLTEVLGAGTSSIAAPTVSIVTPAAGTVAAGFSVHASAGSRRGVAKVEMWLNGHAWATAPGAAFGQSGQANPSDYTLTAPATVPGGVIDLVVKAYDDLDLETDSTTVTVQMGAPCATADSCLTGQKCEAGKCFWDAPVGVLGDACTYNEFCVTGMCQQSDIGQYCTQNCVVGSSDGCPAKFDCIATSDTGGVCLPQDQSGGGCCSVEGHESNRSIWAHLGLGMFALGFIVRKRRR
ncbi:MAG: Ig-like domain-containing protein [Kofleriaceae bacterium]